MVKLNVCSATRCWWADISYHLLGYPIWALPGTSLWNTRSAALVSAHRRNNWLQAQKWWVRQGGAERKSYSKPLVQRIKEVCAPVQGMHGLACFHCVRELQAAQTLVMEGWELQKHHCRGSVCWSCCLLLTFKDSLHLKASGELLLFKFLQYNLLSHQI